MNLKQWAHDWGLPDAAIIDLQNRLTAVLAAPENVSRASNTEASVQNADVYQFITETGGNLWRNNVGTAVDPSGRHVRFGLANESKKINARIKSADYVGIKPVVVTPKMIGTTIGQFVSREYKKAGWKYSNTPREQAQINWANLINALGGEACFVTRDKI